MCKYCVIILTFNVPKHKTNTAIFQDLKLWSIYSSIMLTLVSAFAVPPRALLAFESSEQIVLFFYSYGREV